jgi:hypothetical protein
MTIDKADLVKRFDEMVAFLDGSGDLDGAWFGARVPNEPAFWWRTKYLTPLAADIRTALTQQSQGRDEVLEEAAQYVENMIGAGDPDSTHNRALKSAAYWIRAALKSPSPAPVERRSEVEDDPAIVLQRHEEAACTCGAAGTGEGHPDWCDWVYSRHNPDATAQPEPQGLVHWVRMNCMQDEVITGRRLENFAAELDRRAAITGGK